jgi:protein-S-isoprenylcysteine O-methyltransferase Ste14
MGRSIAALYGIVSYLIFLVVFLYAIGFVGDILVPKSINSGVEGSIVASVLVNLVLLSIFALQHTIMARPAFKKVWTRIVPTSVERTTYVLLSSLALALIFAYWQPMQSIIWDASGTALGSTLVVAFWAGWGIVLTSTFMIDHFDLFGLRQVYANFKQIEMRGGGFQKRLFYRLVRHPIMTGFLIAFWAAPTMTTGHLLFAVVTSVYIYIAVKHFEEKDLVAEIGQEYITYQQEVGAFVPGVGKAKGEGGLPAPDKPV